MINVPAIVSNSVRNMRRRGGGVVESFSFEIQTSGSDDTFTLPLPLSGTYDFTVDWGDGSGDVITSYNQAEATHTFATEGTYIVSIPYGGTCTKFQFNNTGDRAMITKLLSCCDLGFTALDFYGCSNLTSVCSLGTLASLTSGYAMFNACTSLEEIVPGMFDGCTNLASSGFRAIFGGCTSITSIPSGLFDNCVNVSAWGFGYCFYGISITSIPSGLFDYNVNVSTYGFESTFENCTLLTSIPSGLFDNCVNVSESGFKETFRGCTNLAHTLESDMLANNTFCNSVSAMFYGCTNLEGSGLDFISACPASITGGTTTQCFTSCTGLSDYASIPSAWGGGGA